MMELPNSNWQRALAKRSTPYVIPDRFGKLRLWLDETPLSLATTALVAALLALVFLLATLIEPLMGRPGQPGNPQVTIEKVVLGKSAGNGSAPDDEEPLQESQNAAAAPTDVAAPIAQVNVPDPVGSLPDSRTDRTPAPRQAVQDLQGTVAELDSRQQQAAANAAAAASAAGRPGLADVDGLSGIFKVDAKVKSVVYVIDMSGSMSGQPLEIVKAELLHGIQSLKEDQEFAVVFFDDFAWPMLMPQGLELTAVPQSLNLLKATSVNKQRVITWIGLMQGGGGTNPIPAMDLAIRSKPDLVMLLSDGEFRDDAVQFIAHQNRHFRGRKGQIDCIGLAENIQTLRDIARQNGGKYFAASLTP